MKGKERIVRAVLFAASLLVLMLGYRLMLLNHAPDVFRATEEDMSYAWYVPIFSLYVLWRERREILASVGKPSLWGAFFAVPALCVGFLGIRGAQLRFEELGFIGLLVSLTWLVWGARTMRQTLFAFLFLLFCVPLTSFLDLITIHLRLLATSTACAFLKGVGVGIVRQGTMIFSPDGAFSIDVADPCSGLRSLFALMALTAGYAYYAHATWLKRAILFACSVPIAVAGNVVRILSIVLVGLGCSSEFATGFYHDYSGYVVFGASISLMLGVSGVIARFRDHNPSVACVSAASSPRATLPQMCALAVFTVFFGVAMIWQAQTPVPVLALAPAVAMAEIEGFRSEPFEPSEAELQVLPADTTFVKRVYTEEDGTWFRVSAVIGGRSKSSIHRPELCLPAQGFQMRNPRERTVSGVEWHFVTLARKEASSLGFAYTFFNQTGYRTSSHVRRIFRDVWDRSVLNRIDRWVMLTVNSSTADERKMTDFLEKLHGALTCSIP